MKYNKLKHSTLQLAAMSAASLVKLLLNAPRRLSSRGAMLHPSVEVEDGRTLLILANGPSLRTVIDQQMPMLKGHDCLAVNFAANAPEFTTIRPKYYVIVDPHFFEADPAANTNIGRLWQALGAVDWLMTLIVPLDRLAQARRRLADNSTYVTVRGIPAFAVEGASPLEYMAFSHQWAMPRPRNVLIPAIMCGIWLGYQKIDIYGADHSWTQTLGVDDQNRVVNFQPHFYADDSDEHRRVASVYADIPLHSVLESMTIAFRSYHHIQRWARRQGVVITNRTPGSMIDAFAR